MPENTIRLPSPDEIRQAIDRGFVDGLRKAIKGHQNRPRRLAAALTLLSNDPNNAAPPKPAHPDPHQAAAIIATASGLAERGEAHPAFGAYLRLCYSLLHELQPTFNPDPPYTTLGYNPDQPRDSHGRWVKEGDEEKHESIHTHLTSWVSLMHEAQMPPRSGNPENTARNYARHANEANYQMHNLVARMAATPALRDWVNTGDARQREQRQQQWRQYWYSVLRYSVQNARQFATAPGGRLGGQRQNPRNFFPTDRQCPRPEGMPDPSGAATSSPAWAALCGAIGDMYDSAPSSGFDSNSALNTIMSQAGIGGLAAPNDAAPDR